MDAGGAAAYNTAAKILQRLVAKEAQMSAGIWFWILYVLAVVFGGWGLYPISTAPGGRPGFVTYGGPLLLYVLLGVLGWGTFGPPIR